MKPHPIQTANAQRGERPFMVQAPELALDHDGSCLAAHRANASGAHPGCATARGGLRSPAGKRRLSPTVSLRRLPLPHLDINPCAPPARRTGLPSERTCRTQGAGIGRGDDRERDFVMTVSTVALTWADASRRELRVLRLLGC